MAKSLKMLFLSCQHNEQAFDELFQRTSSTVFHISRHYFLTTWDEDDIFQEARLILYRMLQCFQYDDLSEREFERLFYGYYRQSLIHHYTNRLRYEQAQKRDFRMTIYTQELDTYPFEYSVEETALTRVNWHNYCRYDLDAEECELLEARYLGHSLKDCAKRFHHGIRYTSQSLHQLHQRWDDKVK